MRDAPGSEEDTPVYLLVLVMLLSADTLRLMSDAPPNPLSLSVVVWSDSSDTTP